MTSRTRPARRLLPLALLLACAAACTDEAPAVPAATTVSSPTAADGAHAVRLASVRWEPWPLVVRATGEFVAFDDVTLSARVPGVLASLDVDIGSRVQAGDVLASVRTRDYELRVQLAEAAVRAARARLGAGPEADGELLSTEATAAVREAQAELDASRREYARLTDLLTDRTVSQALVDGAEARHAAAESRLQAAREQIEGLRATLSLREVELAIARAELEDARLVAPFDGAVAQRLAGLGEYLAVARPVLRLVRFDPVRLRLEVPEREAPRMREGLAVVVEALSEGSPGGRRQADGAPTPRGGDASAPTAVEGRLVRISPELDRGSRTLVVEASFDNPEGVLRPGTFVRADIVVDPDAPALVVSPEALVRFAGVDRVFVVADGVAEERQVSVGRVASERVEILTGLGREDVVVLAPGGLRAGDAVVAAP